MVVTLSAAATPVNIRLNSIKIDNMGLYLMLISSDVFYILLINGIHYTTIILCMNTYRNVLDV
ncbi:hypothetical protein GCM10025860_22430 [Methanobacterium ferruginis]|nr:hypothetical protein GCM10025860_22430 [Methanobacterium ferruginis]